jgi:CheY-like chemotaxis protein
MDGLEATKAIRAMDRADAGTIPIIALTANAFDEDVQRIVNQCWIMSEISCRRAYSVLH